MVLAYTVPISLFAAVMASVESPLALVVAVGLSVYPTLTLIIAATSKSVESTPADRGTLSDTSKLVVGSLIVAALYVAIRLLSRTGEFAFFDVSGPRVNG